MRSVCRHVEMSAKMLATQWARSDSKCRIPTCELVNLMELQWPRLAVTNEAIVGLQEQRCSLNRHLRCSIDEMRTSWGSGCLSPSHPTEFAWISVVHQLAMRDNITFVCEVMYAVLRTPSRTSYIVAHNNIQHAYDPMDCSIYLWGISTFNYYLPVNPRLSFILVFAASV